MLRTFARAVSWAASESRSSRHARVILLYVHPVESPAVQEVIRSNTILFAPEVKLPVQ